MYDGHFWCKVKMINIKMISTLLFARQSNWVIQNVKTSFAIIW